MTKLKPQALGNQSQEHQLLPQPPSESSCQQEKVSKQREVFYRSQAKKETKRKVAKSQRKAALDKRSRLALLFCLESRLRACVVHVPSPHLQVGSHIEFFRTVPAEMLPATSRTLLCLQTDDDKARGVKTLLVAHQGAAYHQKSQGSTNLMEQGTN